MKRSIIVSAAVFLLAFLFFSPILLVLLNSLKSEKEFVASFLALPKALDLGNYAAAMEKMRFLQAFWNTLVVTVLSLGLLVILASMTAYKLSRVRVLLSRVLAAVLLSSLLIPTQGLIVPIVVTAKDFGLLNSLAGLILFEVVAMGSVTVFMYQGFLNSVPRELDESGYMDGASGLRLFFPIIFPLLQPITTSVLILMGLATWNNFLLPLILVTDRNAFTLPLALRAFFGTWEVEFTEYFAGAMLSSLPVMALFLFAQKFFERGITAGALKG